MDLGEIIRALIEEEGISQKDMAQDLNLAPSTLGNYVRGLREPDFQTLKTIADYFHVTTDYLLNHHPAKIDNREEDQLLQLYYSMSPKYRALYLQIGALFPRYNND